MTDLLTKSCDNTKTESTDLKKKFRNLFCLKIFVLVTSIKVLLIPTYHSTDFEVHRNWLAITYNLKINEWYKSEKSQWTLDYPPFFAWFEYVLSTVAVFFDNEMLKLNNFNYASANAKFFQRLTVMCADLFFVYGVKEVGNVFCTSSKSFGALVLLSLCNIGLLVVDHVHFQYNGFLLGVLLISIAKVSNKSKESNILQGAMWFTVLLNLKHIYLYVAPAYGIWLLKSYCLRSNTPFSRFFKLGLIVIFIFLLSFGPFITQLPQLLARLFPFKRGLVHAYWAANAWALYAGSDKFLSVIWNKFGWLDKVKTASMTGGLVQEDSFTILPTPTPLVTFIITFLLLIPALWMLFSNTKRCYDPRSFVKCVVICGLTSFMFGWHVHEKAILTAIVPLGILAITDVNDARIFILLSSAGHAALFPLLYPLEYAPLKLLLWLTYLAIVLFVLKKRFGDSTLYLYEWLYVAIIPAITIYESIVHKLIFGDKLPFLPLAITSIYCSLGVAYSYVIYYYQFISEDVSVQKRKRGESESSLDLLEEKDL